MVSRLTLVKLIVIGPFGLSGQLLLCSISFRFSTEWTTIVETPQLDDSEQKQDQNDEQDEADSAAAVVTESWTQAIASKTEHQNQDDKKD
jgi:hypothetical protein